MEPSYPIAGIDERKITSWIKQNQDHSGFLEYFKLRDYQLLKALGNGVKGSSQDVLLGQRLELLKLMRIIQKKK